MSESKFANWKVWECKIGVSDEEAKVYDDLTLRNPLEDAFKAHFGYYPVFVASGWGYKLTEIEIKCLEDLDKRDNNPNLADQARDLVSKYSRAKREEILTKIGDITKLAMSAITDDVLKAATAGKRSTDVAVFDIIHKSKEIIKTISDEILASCEEIIEAIDIAICKWIEEMGFRLAQPVSSFVYNIKW